MSESEDSSLLLNTVLTNKISTYAAIGSREFQAIAERCYSNIWNHRDTSAVELRSVAVMIQTMLVLKRIMAMPEAEARRQYIVKGYSCRRSIEIDWM